MQTRVYNLKNWKPYFFTIWGGQQFSLIGSALVDFALVWYMTETTGSAVILTTATLVGMLPKIFFSPFLGALVDRWKRRYIMVFADGLIALATVGLAVLFWLDLVQIWHIYILLFIRTISGVMHYTAMQSSTSLMVPEKHLTRVAGLNQTLNGIINIAGAPLGAFCMMILPIHSILAIDVLTAAFAISPLLFISIPEPAKTQENEAFVFNFSTIAEDLKIGLRFVRSWPGMISLFAVGGIVNIFLQPAFALIPLLVSRYYQGGAVQYGMVGPAFGFGVIAGGLLLSTWGGFKNRIVTIFTGGSLMGLSILLCALAPADMFWLALASFFVTGLAVTFTDGPMTAFYQANIPPELQGRVLSFSVTVSRIAAPLGLIAAGPLADFLDIRYWYWGGGLAVILICLAGVLNRNLMNLEKNSSRSKQAALENSLAENI